MKKAIAITFIAYYSITLMVAGLNNVLKEDNSKKEFICREQCFEKETELESISVEQTTYMSNYVETVEVEDVEVQELVSLGNYKITAYCSCSKCCGSWANNRPNGVVVGSTGEELIADYSIAVDPKVIPYGSIVEINGKEYKAMDCGGAIKGNRIDIYMNSHQDALVWGVQKHEVFLKK